MPRLWHLNFEKSAQHDQSKQLQLNHGMQAQIEDIYQMMDLSENKLIDYKVYDVV